MSGGGPRGPVRTWGVLVILSGQALKARRFKLVGAGPGSGRRPTAKRSAADRKMRSAADTAKTGHTRI